jgi:hypothetical protein
VSTGSDARFDVRRRRAQTYYNSSGIGGRIKRKSGTTPHPRRASASAPERDGRKGVTPVNTGQGRQRERAQATVHQQQAHIHQQARPHQQQKLQRIGHSRSRQEPITQQHKQTGDKQLIERRWESIRMTSARTAWRQLHVCLHSRLLGTARLNIPSWGLNIHLCLQTKTIKCDRGHAIPGMGCDLSS